MQSSLAFQEICKASTMQAVTAMSKFLNTPFKFDIKPIKVGPIQKIDLPSHSNETSVGLVISIDSFIKGASVLVSTTKAAFAICDLMLERATGSTSEITEVEESALKELANIVLGHFLTSLAHSLLTKSMLHSPAVYEENTPSIIIKHIRSMLENKVGEHTVVNIAFAYEHSNMKGEINIFLDASKVDFLFKEMMEFTRG